MTDILTVRVSELGRYDVVSADEVNAMLGLEKMKDALACDSVSCAAELGGALGVDYMLAGNVGRLGNQLNIKLTLFDSRAMKVERRILHQLDYDETLFSNAINAALRKLVDLPDDKPTLTPPATEKTPEVEGQTGAPASATMAAAVHAEHLALPPEVPPINPYQQWGQISFWTGLGGGGLLAAVGQIGASLTASAYRTNLQPATRETNHLLSDVALSGWILAATGMTAGVILWLLDPGDEAGGAEGAALWPSVSPSGLTGGTW